MKSDQLITELLAQTTAIIKHVQQYQEYELSTLQWRLAADSWTILECIAHLNLYGAFYLPEFERRLVHAKPASEAVFYPGLLGDYFAKSMLPAGKLSTMKTFKDKNPLGQSLDQSTIDEFLQQQRRLLELLERSRTVSLNKTKINISISRFLKLKLGDGFRFYINHILRHLEQMKRIEQAMASSVHIASKRSLCKP